ncbi:MAG: hypothetical protein SFT91_03425 [Rickettsiaceae bacterium]|nr:hypothetical protein [Rickettsiaceae bacterium]
MKIETSINVNKIQTSDLIKKNELKVQKTQKNMQDKVTISSQK